MIYNEWFRDENLEAPLMIGYKKTDEGGTEKDATPYGNTPVNDAAATTNMSEARLYARAPAKASKFHDYFTSCLPSPLKSDPVEISLTGNAPVRLGNDNGALIPALEKGNGPEMVLGVNSTSNAPGSLTYTTSAGNGNKKGCNSQE